MKNNIKTSNFYFATGLLLCLFSIVSKNKQVLNIYDTYYVISGNDFAVFISLIYLAVGVLYLVIEKHLHFGLKVLQYLMFTIPIVYFIYLNGNDFDTPEYYLANPIAYQWKTVLLAEVLIYGFLLSIVLLLILFVFAFWKWKKSKE
jgi:hypothetical protein